MSGFLSNLFNSPDGANQPNPNQQQPGGDGTQSPPAGSSNIPVSGDTQNQSQNPDSNQAGDNNQNGSPPQEGGMKQADSVSSSIAQAKQDSSVVSSHVDPVKEQGKAALSHMDPRASQVLVHAYEETKRIKQTFIEPDQLFLALISDREVFKLMQDFKVDVAKLVREIQEKEKVGTFTGEPTLGETSKQLLEEAYLNAKKREVEYLSPEDILLVYFSKQTSVTEPLKKEGLEKAKIEEKLSKSTEFKTGRKSVLDQFGVDLTEKARKGELDPVTGRDKEVERMVHILLRRSKNNPVIIGEAGVGKTAIVEGLAQMMVQGKVTPELAKKKIIQLDISNLIAGASHRGEFEERLQGVIKEVMSSAGQIILFIDEIHTILGAGSTDGAMDASNIVKPYLSRGQLQVIGATTTSEYRKNFEKDRAFERRFQPIVCDEPTEEVAIEMIKILMPKYEKFHQVKFSEDAIKAAVHLSKRYIGDRSLPDKAIDLMDEAAAEVKLSKSGGIHMATASELDPNAPKTDQKTTADSNNQDQNTSPTASATTQTGDPAAPATETGQSDPASQDQTTSLSQDAQKGLDASQGQQATDQSGLPLVQEEDIQKVVSRWTGVPITKLTEKESEKLLHMEDIIHKNFINHERAVAAVSEAIRRGRIGLASANRPIASFIFLGPTGTGKTELAKVLAEIMFGKKDAMIRLDMSEYMEKHEVAKLVGAPPGYVGYEEGGQLTEAVRSKPYSIVLFDEIEKAHPDVFNIMLQLLEDGRLTDNKGNTISFKNTIVICTSNIGSAMIQQKLQSLPSGEAASVPDAQPGQETASASNLPVNPSPEAVPAAVTPQSLVPGQPPVPGQPAAPVTPVLTFDPNNPSAIQETPQIDPATGLPIQPGQTPQPSADQGPQLATGTATGNPSTASVSASVTPPAAPVQHAPTNSIVTTAPKPGEVEKPEDVQRNKVFQELSGMVMDELTKHFRPELINRFDEVVVFEPLTQDNMVKIASLGIEATKKLLKEQNIDLQISQAALDQLAKEGYDPVYGARPLRRLIQRSIENPIAIYLIERSAQAGDSILIDYDSSKDSFTFQKAPSPDHSSAPGTPPPDATPPVPGVPPEATGTADTVPGTGLSASPAMDANGQPIVNPMPPAGESVAGQTVDSSAQATAPAAGPVPEWLAQVTESAQGTGTADTTESTEPAGTAPQAPV